MTCDLIVIGAGPGGYGAAIRAKQQGAARVVLIEKSHAGGTCLNVGCIPSKTLIATAQRMEHLKHAAQLGISGVASEQLSVNVPALMERKNKIVNGMRGGIEQLLKGHGVELMKGAGHIDAPGRVSINGETLETKNILIATGSTWRTLPSLPIDGNVVCVSDHMIEWSEVPKSLLIVGGGVIGCEFATMMAAFGTQVTIVEFAETLIAAEDAVVGRTLARFMGKKGVTIHTGTTVTDLSVSGTSATATLSNGQTVSADKVLVAVGRQPFTENLGAKELGLVNERGFIDVDTGMRTKVAGIFAIGDVVPTLALAHVASAEGDVAATNALGGNAQMHYHAVPRPIFTLPEACGVGRTEKELQTAGVNFKTGRFNYAAVSKAMCSGETDGSLQVYADADSGKILGGHIIGAEAVDLGQQLCIAVANELTVSDIGHTIFSHPTLSEIVKEGIEDAVGLAVHKVGPKRS